MAKGTFLERGFKHAGRYKKIITVLVKYGFEDMLSHIRINKYFPASRHLMSQKAYDDIIRFKREERIRMVLEELGPSFVKLGQIMSNRPDLLPLELLHELEKLQDNAPAFESKEVRSIISDGLGSSPDQLFAEFSEKPIASASIAQVHIAETKEGQKVAVKVQRPDILETIKTDVDIMYSLAGLMEKYWDEAQYYQPLEVVRIFQKTILKELDFITEADNMQRFAENFSENPHIIVPEVYAELSSDKVLTMSHIEGKKISEIIDENPEGYDRKLIAERGVELFFTQVFMHGFFHADPHSGNLFVLKENKIAFIDFGMMGYLGSSAREELSNMFIGIELHDTRRIVRSISKFSGNGEIEDREKLERRLELLIDEYAYKSLDSIKVESVIKDLRKIIVDHKIRIPADFFLLFKAMVTIEGIGNSLHPELNLIQQLKPYVKKVIKHRLEPSGLLKKFYLSLMDVGSFINDLPMDFKDVVDRIKKGKVRVDLEHTGTEPIIEALDMVSNRIAVAIVLASIVLASSIIILADIPPRYNDIPIFGMIGYLISAIFGVWLVILIMRRRNF